MSVSHESQRTGQSSTADANLAEPTPTPAGADVQRMIAQSGGDPVRLAQLIIASGGLNNANMLNALHAQLGTQNAMRVTHEVLRLQNRESEDRRSPAEPNATTAAQPTAATDSTATTAATPTASAPQTQAGPTTAAPQTEAAPTTSPSATAAPATSGGVSTVPIDREVLGIRIHAPAGVRPGAIDQVASIIQTEIGRNPLAQEQLRRKHVSVVIIPARVAMTDLPEFQSLRGKHTFDGRDWSTVRGEGGTRYHGRFNIAVAEETVVNTDVASAYPATYSVAMHEFAHALNNYGMTQSQRSRVRELFRQHQQRDRDNAAGTWTDTYASSDSDEYFAQATNTFFGRNAMGSNRNGREVLRETDPNMYEFLVTMYEAPDVNTQAVATVA